MEKSSTFISGGVKIKNSMTQNVDIGSNIVYFCIYYFLYFNVNNILIWYEVSS